MIGDGSRGRHDMWRNFNTYACTCLAMSAYNYSLSKMWHNIIPGSPPVQREPTIQSPTWQSLSLLNQVSGASFSIHLIYMCVELPVHLHYMLVVQGKAGKWSILGDVTQRHLLGTIHLLLPNSRQPPTSRKRTIHVHQTILSLRNAPPITNKWAGVCGRSTSICHSLHHWASLAWE